MMLYTPLQAPPVMPLHAEDDQLIDDLSAAALALCTLARITAPQQALTLLSRFAKELEDDHAFENLMRAGAYPEAAQWILERSEGPAKVNAQLSVRIGRTLQALRREAIEADAPEWNTASRGLESAFEELKGTWLTTHHPDGYGGCPELKLTRRALLKCRALPADLDFDALEASLAGRLEEADAHALEGLLDPRRNPYSCAVFTHLTGVSLPGRAELRASVIRSALDPARLLASEAKAREQSAQSAAARLKAQHAELERRLETRAVQQYGTMLHFARHLLEHGYRLHKRRKGAVTITDALSSDGKSRFVQLDPDLRDWLQGKGMPTVTG